MHVDKLQTPNDCKQWYRRSLRTGWNSPLRGQQKLLQVLLYGNWKSALAPLWVDVIGAMGSHLRKIQICSLKIHEEEKRQNVSNKRFITNYWALSRWRENRTMLSARVYCLTRRPSFKFQFGNKWAVLYFVTHLYASCKLLAYFCSRTITFI